MFINHITRGFFLSLLSKPTPNSAALVVPHQILRRLRKTSNGLMILQSILRHARPRSRMNPSVWIAFQGGSSDDKYDIL